MPSMTLLWCKNSIRLNQCFAKTKMHSKGMKMPVTDSPISEKQLPACFGGILSIKLHFFLSVLKTMQTNVLFKQ